MSVPTTMVAASTSASTQEVPTGVNATVATTYRLMGRAVQTLLKVLFSLTFYSIILCKHPSVTVLCVLCFVMH